MHKMGKCATCGAERYMYYQPLCPNCNKPKVKMIETLNLIEICYWLEVNGHKQIANRLHNEIEGNDQYTKVYFDENDEFALEDDELATNDDNEIMHLTKSDKKFLRETFDIKGEEVAFWVSW